MILPSDQLCRLQNSAPSLRPTSSFNNNTRPHFAGRATRFKKVRSSTLPKEEKKIRLEPTRLLPLTRPSRLLAHALRPSFRTQRRKRRIRSTQFSTKRHFTLRKFNFKLKINSPRLSLIIVRRREVKEGDCRFGREGRKGSRRACRVARLGRLFMKIILLLLLPVKLVTRMVVINNEKLRLVVLFSLSLRRASTADFEFGIQMNLSQLNWALNDFSTRMLRINDQLSTRISNLEIVNHSQQNEITTLRHLVESSHSSTSVRFRSSPPPPPSFASTTPNHSDSDIFQEPFTPPPSVRRTRPVASLQPSSPQSNRRSSVPFMTAISSSPSSSNSNGNMDHFEREGQSPNDHLVRRRSRAGIGGGTEIRPRRVSLTAIAPVVAQVKWMAQQQVRLKPALRTPGC